MNRISRVGNEKINRYFHSSTMLGVEDVLERNVQHPESSVFCRKATRYVVVAAFSKANLGSKTCNHYRIASNYWPNLRTTRPSISTATRTNVAAPIESKRGHEEVTITKSHSELHVESPSSVNKARSFSSNAVFAILDQGIVSATSFLTMLIVSRACGPESLAYFSLGMNFFLISTSLQLAFVAPYTLLIPSTNASDKKAFSGSAFLGTILSAITAVVIIALLYPAFLFSGAVPGFAKMILFVLFLSPFLILREFARRFPLQT